jgi:hypothetical protein
MWHSLMRALDRASAEAWQAMVAVALCLLLPGLAALALWPAGRSALGLRLLKGYCLLWLVVFVLYLLVAFVQRRLRWDLYSHADAFLLSNVVTSGLPTVGWASFAALAARDAADGAGVLPAAVVYLVGMLSGIVACQVMGSFYSGHVYKLACLALALACFPVFAAWPGAARGLFGWFFRLF